MMRLQAILILFISLLGVEPAYSFDSCESIFADSSPAHDSTPPTFNVMEVAKNLTRPLFRKRDPGQWHQLSLRRKVRMQNCGTCWLNSGVSHFEYSVQAQGVSVPQISVDYLMARDLIQNAQDYVFLGANLNVHEGNDPRKSYTLMKRYGVMPEEAFPVKDVDWPALALKIRAAINPIQNRLRRGRFVPEAERWAAESEAKKRATEIVEEALGQAIPSSFRYGDRSWDPYSYHNFLLEGSTENFLGMATMNAQTKSWMLQSLQKIIADGQAPLVTLKWSFRQEDGYLIFDPTKTDSEYHAILITGYFEKDGKITALKLQNSWGEKHGQEGYDLIRMEDFLLSIRDFFTRSSPQP